MLKLLFVNLCMILFCSGCETASSAASALPEETTVSTMTPPPAKPAFAPTFKSGLEDPYSNAAVIYDSSPKAPAGVYPYGGLVFVIVEIDTNKEEIKYREGTAMLRAVARLREKYPKLPPQFNVRNRVVEKDFDEETGIYRYAQAYRLADITRLQKGEP